ncbi:MAG: hypothetical protein M0D54_10835 [Hyphomonadaceae bacterium JAD_PAG50586_4]|nr:MAG: hypothetical protein M0D54_10835 [Hyphomonadaceae bacterium JAD_PAG50586_4]
MSQILKMKAADDSEAVIYIEVGDDSAGAAIAAHEVSRLRQDELRGVPPSFQEAMKRIKPALNELIEGLSDYSVSEMQVEFGLKLAGQAGFIFTSTSGEVNFKVAMKVTRGAPETK